MLNPDNRDFALALVQDEGFDTEAMLIACLVYMSNDDVGDMLHSNEYPTPDDEGCSDAYDAQA